MAHRPVCRLLFLVGLASCASPALDQFAGSQPVFDPVRFFTGHVQSWGVLENRSGEPTTPITTDCLGNPDGTDGVHMMQHLTEGAKSQVRAWHMRRVTASRYEATANDIVGTAAGDVSGRVFHLRYTLALAPGNALKNVSMDQWMYLMDDGSLVNRATVSKFGTILAEVTEHFRHTDQIAASDPHT